MVQPRPEPGDPVTAPIPVAERIRLIRDSLINYSGVLVAGVVGIAVVPTMLDRLGAESYGLWVAVLASVAVIGEVDFGLSTIVTREVAAAPRTDHAGTGRLLAAVGVWYLALAIVGAVLVGSLGNVVEGELKLSSQVRNSVPFVFAMGGVLSFAGRVMAYCIAFLYGVRRFGRVNVIISSVAVLSGGGTIALLVGGGGLEAVAAWQAVAGSMAAVVALSIAGSDWRAAALGFPRPSWNALRSHLPFGLASQLVTVGVNLLWVAPPLLIGSISGSRAIASYDVGRKFPLALSAIGWRSSEAFFPTASREGRAGSIQRRRDVLDAVTRWNLVLALPLSVVLGLLAPNLLAAWLETPPAHATVILQLLALAVFVDAFGAGALHVLWAEGRTRALLVILGITTVAGLGLMAALLWQIGVVGAAMAVASAIAARSLFLLVAVTRAQRVPLPSLLKGSLLGLVVPLIVCSSATLALRELIDPGGWVGVVGVGIAAIVAYLVALSFGGARAEERAILDAATRLPRFAISGLYRRSRRALRQVAPLRSAWYLAHELAGMVGPGAKPTASKFDRQFAAKVDPWDYESEPEQERYRAALAMLDGGRAGSHFLDALEIGCAEGAFTELLVKRCNRLTAIDISPVALARARTRLRHCQTITFAQSDVLRDPELGTFDLVVVMDVLHYFKRPGDLRRVQARIHRMLLPGSHLLVTTERQSDVFEKARWRHWIPRGRMINESFSLLPGICALESRLTAMHLVTLYVRTDG
jgi:O-antigen/teichoic acid export membrane protein/2-polyprenyl-3-methyl-5-hydroxy-6-metoxy-1,4-benzoquinol methylase